MPPLPLSDLPPGLRRKVLNGGVEVFRFGWGVAVFDVVAVARRLVAGTLPYSRGFLVPSEWTGYAPLSPRIDPRALRAVRRIPGLLAYPGIVVRFRRQDAAPVSVLIDGNHRVTGASEIGVAEFPSIVVPGEKLEGLFEARRSFWTAMGIPPR